MSGGDCVKRYLEPGNSKLELSRNVCVDRFCANWIQKWIVTHDFLKIAVAVAASVNFSQYTVLKEFAHCDEF